MKKTIVIVYDGAVINGGAAKIAIQSAVELAKNPDLHLCKLDSFDGETLQEKEIGTYSVSDMTINSKRNYRRVHTLNKMGSLEVIDLLYYQFNPTILLEKAKRVIKK